MRKPFTILLILMLFHLFGKADNKPIDIVTLTNETQKAIELSESYSLEEALELLYSTLGELEEAELEPEKKLKAKIFFEIGKIFFKINYFDDALEYNQKAINISTELNDNEKLSECHYFRARVLFSKYESIELSDSIDLKLIKFSRDNYLKSLSFKEQIDPNANKTEFFRNIGNSYIQEKNTKEAIRWVNEALEEAKKFNDSEAILKAELLLTRAYVDEKRFDEAVYLGLKSLERIKQDDSLEDLSVHFHHNLYEAYRGMDNTTEAFFHLKKAYEYGYADAVEEKNINSINNKRLRDKAKEIEKRESLTATKVKKVRDFNTALIISLLGLGLITTLIIRSQKLKQQNLQLELKQKEQEAELNTINAMIDGRESERKDIGQFLHDHVSALVNTANIQLEVLANEKGLMQNKKLVNAQSILDDIADKVRNVSHQLLSNVLQKYGLAVAFDELCNNLTGSKISFYAHSTLSENRRFKESIENKLYGVVQELCNNIIKHSKASEAHLYLSESESYLKFKITDNGIGFKEEDIKKGGIGLYQVRSRINSMGGKLTLKNDGLTIIKISIPLAIAN